MHEDDISKMEETPPHSLPNYFQYLPTSTHLLLACACLEGLFALLFSLLG